MNDLQHQIQTEYDWLNLLNLWLNKTRFAIIWKRTNRLLLFLWSREKDSVSAFGPSLHQILRRHWWLKKENEISPRWPWTDGSSTSMRRRRFLRPPLHHPIFLLGNRSSSFSPSITTPSSLFCFRILHHAAQMINSNRKHPEDIKILSEFHLYLWLIS